MHTMLLSSMAKPMLVLSVASNSLHSSSFRHTLVTATSVPPATIRLPCKATLRCSTSCELLKLRYPIKLHLKTYLFWFLQSSKYLFSIYSSEIPHSQIVVNSLINVFATSLSFWTVSVCYSSMKIVYCFVSIHIVIKKSQILFTVQSEQVALPCRVIRTRLFSYTIIQ